VKRAWARERHRAEALKPRRRSAWAPWGNCFPHRLSQRAGDNDAGGILTRVRNGSGGYVSPTNQGWHQGAHMKRWGKRFPHTGPVGTRRRPSFMRAAARHSGTGCCRAAPGQPSTREAACRFPQHCDAQKSIGVRECGQWREARFGVAGRRGALTLARRAAAGANRSFGHADAAEAMLEEVDGAAVTSAR
jgi:hypothetical protein